MLTLGDAKALLAGYIPASQDAGTAINLALERIINSGRWKGTNERVAMFPSASGILTLPRRYKAVLGVKVGGYVRPIANQWFEYMPGSGDHLEYHKMLHDLGDGYCTFRDLDSLSGGAFTLRARCDDTSATLTVQGFDQNGYELFASNGSRGISVAVNGTATTAQFTRISSLLLNVRAAPVFLSAIDIATGTEVPVGYYEPGETRPSYKRYAISGNGCVPQGGRLVTALCQIRHVTLSDGDLLPIENVGALKQALMALAYEDQGESDRAAKFFAAAVELLEEELASSRSPDERGLGLRVQSVGDWAGWNSPMY